MTRHTSRIWPDLHRVDGKDFVEGVVPEREVFDAAESQIDPARLDRFHIPSRRLLQHFRRIVDAANLSPKSQVSHLADRYTWPESDFEHRVVWLNVEQIDQPHSDVAIHARHYVAPKLPSAPRG